MKNFIPLVTVSILLCVVPSRSDRAALRSIMNADPLTVHTREGKPDPQNVNIFKERNNSPPARQAAASTQMKRQTFATDPIEKPKWKPDSSQAESFRLSPGQSFSMGTRSRNSPPSRGRKQRPRQIRPKQARSTLNRWAPSRRRVTNQMAEPARPLVRGTQIQPGTQFLKPCPPHRFPSIPKNIGQTDFEQEFLMKGIWEVVNSRDCYPSDLIVYLRLLLDERKRRFRI